MARSFASKLAVATALCIAGHAPAHAQTLPQALEMAYRNSPRLDAERARLRATGEEVPRAYAGFHPSLQASAYVEAKRRDTKPQDDGDGPVRPSGTALTLTQPVFSGWRTVNQVLEAEAGVRSGREQLRLIEQTVLLEAATAYVDIVRDRAIVQLRERQLHALAREVGVVQARLAAQEVTSTDLAQVRTRRAGAAADLDVARGALRQSEAAFERFIGAPPKHLATPAPLARLLPGSRQEAVAIASRESPLVVAALYREQAARHTVDRIHGELLPEVRLEGSYARDLDGNRETEEVEVASIKGRLVVPLYSGGEVQARVRQAKHTHVSRLQEIEQSRSEVRAQAEAAWALLAAARAARENIKQQVQSSRTALSGVRDELNASARTVLDLLNAEQEVVNAEIAEVQAKRNFVLASFALLAAIGRLTIEQIGTDLPVYDAAADAPDWRSAWITTEIHSAPAPVGAAEPIARPRPSQRSARTGSGSGPGRAVAPTLRGSF